MKRGIKFRGLRTDGKGWVYGYYTVIKGTHYISQDIPDGSYFDHSALPESVGQFTGLTDKNGIEIYEGDKFDDEDGCFLVVEWIKESCCFGASLYGFAISTGEGSQEVIDNKISCLDRNVLGVEDLTDFEVIGNIHQNPELIGN